MNAPSLIGELFGAFVIIGLLTFGLRKIFISKFGLRRATVIAAALSIAFALLVSTMTGMGQQRFLTYPIGGLIAMLILFTKK